MVLRLYIAGAARSSATVQAVRNFVADFASDAELDVIDVLVDPEVAERDRVIATPMLVQAEPEPERRVVGGFVDAANVRDALNR